MKPHLVLNDEEKQQRFDDKYAIGENVGDSVGDGVGYGVGDGVGDDSDVVGQV